MSNQAVAPRLEPLLEEFFETKTSCDVDGTMSYFSPDLVSYIDATLGWHFDGFDALQAVFEQYMPNWAPPARSYATRILANETSALVHMVDTPELFGGELRILAAIDFADGKIVRWVDYWDSSAFDTALYGQFRTPEDAFSTDLRDGDVPTRAAPELVSAATALQAALAAGDASAARDLLHTDVVLSDMALRTQVIGALESAAYLDRVLGEVPYGRQSVLRHVVGGSRGGGFEWTSATGLVGNTALELGPDGLITGITSVYDSRQLEADHKAALMGAGFAPSS
jgi:ketosteroid isomerase-like protein